MKSHLVQPQPNRIQAQGTAAPRPLPWHTRPLPGLLHEFPEVESTQDEARCLLRDLVPLEEPPAVPPERHLLSVSAAFQSRGRGRHGRIWQAPRGSAVLVSTVFAVPDALGAVRQGFRAALAIALLFEHLSGRPASIKWPNDVLVDGAKLAGILVESFLLGPVRVAIVGAGMNVLDAPLEGSACFRDFEPSASPPLVLEAYLALVGGMLDASDQVREDGEFARRLIPPQYVSLRQGETLNVKGVLPGRFLVELNAGLAHIPFHQVASWGFADP